MCLANNSLRLVFAVCILSAILAVSAASASIVINEMLSNPVSDWNGNGEVSGMDDEFVELFNSGSEPVDISGYVLMDTVFRSTPGEFKLPDGTIIKPGEFLTINVTESSVFQGNDGDCIKLFDAAGSLVDEKEYNATEPDVSFARIPDGEDWKESTTPTPGKSNQ